jgi:hypothetical protein
MVMLLAAGTVLLAGPSPVRAHHCPSNPGNPGGDNWCHTPPPTPRPTAAPTPVPTQPPPPPTAEPAPQPTRQPSRATPRPGRSTPAPGAATTDATPLPDDLGSPLPTVDPATVGPTPEIVFNFDEPAPTPDEDAVLGTEPAATGPGAWAFLFVGFVLGFLIGRASWGFKRKKKQQLFG